jgi:hypothetical protein
MRVCDAVWNLPLRTLCLCGDIPFLQWLMFGNNRIPDKDALDGGVTRRIVEPVLSLVALSSRCAAARRIIL